MCPLHAISLCLALLIYKLRPNFSLQRIFIIHTDIHISSKDFLPVWAGSGNWNRDTEILGGKI